MSICNPQHPFLNEPGLSQRKRASSGLATGGVMIDGRKLADFLNFLYTYAQQLNYQSYHKDEQEGEYTLLKDWRVFFEKSMPFLLARISKYETEELEKKIRSLKQNVDERPTAKNLDILLDFGFESTVLPLYNWFQAIEQEEQRLLGVSGISLEGNENPSSFKQRFFDLVSSELSGTIKTLIGLSNIAASQHCISKPNFFPFLQQGIWDLKITNLVQVAQGDIDLLSIADQLAKLFGQFLGTIKRIREFAAGHIPASLLPLEEEMQKYHEPHLGLMFSFLELFKYLQNDLNSLTEKHLDFFYQKILSIQPKPHQPDHAHLIFEVAKHLDQYLIEEGTIFKDGKDSNKADVLFKLGEEIIIDKAKVERLQTLYLNETKTNIGGLSDKITIEGMYMASMANSYDGSGEPFPDGIIPNWSTLGAKPAKINAPGKATPANHPFARLGLMLASPVLLLQEGKREIEICLEGRYQENTSLDDIDFLINNLDEILTKPYYVLTERVLQELTSIDNPLSDEGRAFLSGLLGAQNPYNFGYDLKACLDIKLEPSCEPMFTEGELKLLESVMERKESSICTITQTIYDSLSLELRSNLDTYFTEIFYQGIVACLPTFVDLPSFQEFLTTTDPDHIEDQMAELKEKLICNNLFHISLTGEEGWYRPKRVKTDIKRNLEQVKLNITITLDEEEPPIICFDKEIFEEDYLLDSPHPIARIELNNELKLLFDPNKRIQDPCCLSLCNQEIDGEIALYQFFRYLQIIDAKIDVKVCGIKKNIIVQNEEGLLDPNSPFQPFGVRPVIIDSDRKKEISEVDDEGPVIVIAPPPGCPEPPPKPELNLIGPCFYLGSNEIFKKCWKDVCIHLNWKDKPSDLARFYAAYNTDLEESDFEVNIAVLDQGQWNSEEEESQPKVLACCPDTDFDNGLQNENGKGANPITKHYNRALFHKVGNGCACSCPKNLPPYPSPFPFEQSITIESRYFQMKKGSEDDICEPNQPYQADTRDGFLRFCLENQDFFHNDYAQVLSTQMIALSNYPEIVPGAIYEATASGNLLVGNEDTDEPQRIEIQDLFKWICEAKDLALCFQNMSTPIFDEDDSSNKHNLEKGNACKTGNGDPRDLTSLLTIVNNLSTELGGILGGELSSLETFINTHRTELNELNDPPFTHGDVRDDFLFKNFFGIDPRPFNSTQSPKSEDIFGNVIHDPDSLMGWFLNLKSSLGDNTDSLKTSIDDIITFLGNPTDQFDENAAQNTLYAFFNCLKDYLIEKCEIVSKFNELSIPIPNEPWTPTIKNICLDYSACADKEDIDLIHLYPFEGTFKHEEIEFSPSLLPIFEDEGTLYVGLKDLRPGSSLNLLFQLAEATADSELDRAEVVWHYLSNNQWIPLREGFEVLSDGTNGLTVSGIVKVALPAGFSRTGNTIMPSDLFWIKASVSGPKDANDQPGKVKAICDTIAVHAQAAKVSFDPSDASDLHRLSSALPAGKIAKMLEPTAGVKKIQQPYQGFGGRSPEEGDTFYRRVSEHLRHKGRAVGMFDYETLVLDAFPEIFKVKCISHDFGLSARQYRMDAELAPGFVVLAVIPDLTKLQPGQGMEPKAPVSLLEEIKAFLKQRISPFVRLKVLNPRFERIGVKIDVKLRKGKNEAYYSAKLKEDLTHFFAPWFISNDSDKLVFGQAVNQSEVVKFVEQLDYVDFIACISLTPDVSLREDCDEDEVKSQLLIEPLTARSILTAGEICVNLITDYCDAYCDDKSSVENSQSQTQQT